MSVPNSNELGFNSTGLELRVTTEPTIPGVPSTLVPFPYTVDTSEYLLVEDNDMLFQDEDGRNITAEAE